jgi:hypothetical protein
MTTLQNGLNLAYWLYKVHPELYAQVLQLAQGARRLGSLGDDVTSFDSGTTTTFDTGSAFDAGGLTDSAVLSSISPDIASIAAPDLVNVSVDTSGFTTPTFQTETDPTGSILDSIGSGLKSMGSWLASGAGLSSLSTIANTVLKANAPAQATVNTQVQRVASGTNPAAITYGINPQGQVVPILTTAGTGSGIGLTFQSLQKLVPPAWQPYVVPGLIALGVWLFVRGRHQR